MNDERKSVMDLIREADDDVRAGGYMTGYVMMNEATRNRLNEEFGVPGGRRRDSIGIVVLPYGVVDVLIDNSLADDVVAAGPHMGVAVDETSSYPLANAEIARLNGLIEKKNEVITKLTIENGELGDKNYILNEEVKAVRRAGRVDNELDGVILAIFSAFSGGVVAVLLMRILERMF